MPQQIGWGTEAKLLYQIKRLAALAGGGGGGGGLNIFPTLAGFPPTGEANQIYLAEDTSFLYYWDGAAYVQMGGGGTVLNEYANSSLFPPVGEVGSIYLATDTSFLYYWNGASYSLIYAPIETPGDKLFLFNYY